MTTADELARDLAELYVFSDFPGDGSLLEAVDGSRDWVRRSKDEVHRGLRLQAASFSLAACRLSGYTLDGVDVRLSRTQELAKGTRLVRAVDVANIEASGEQTSWMRHKRSTVGKVAADRAKAGRRVAVVSAASAYHAGGGFNAGGRHALEEALCMQSTLYLSLERAAELASAQGVPSPAAADPPRRRDGEPWRCHIPRDGVVLSPHVEFFRGDTSEGYPFSPQTFEATVVSVAMPNCAPNLEDAPVDVPNALEYEALLGQKFAALLGAAALEGADCLVMPDAGCGVYMNRPEEVGRAFGEAVRRRCPEAFAEIHLVGSAEFAAAAEEAGRPRSDGRPARGLAAGGDQEEADPERALEALKLTVHTEWDKVQARVDRRAADVVPILRSQAAERDEMVRELEDIESERRRLNRRKAEVQEQLRELARTRAELEAQKDRGGGFLAVCMVPAPTERAEGPSREAD